MPSFFSMIKIIVLLVLVSTGGWYLYRQARNIITGPSITIEQPLNGALITTPSIEISGYGENIKSLTINGRSVFISEDGQFSENVLLPPGYAIITAVTEDRFDREQTIQRIIYREKI